MAVGRSQLERANHEIKHGANVFQLENGYMISNRELPMIPTDDVFFSKTEKDKPNIQFLKDHFYREGRIKEEHALYTIYKAKKLLRAEPNVLIVDGPATGAPAIASLSVCFLTDSCSLR